MRNMGRTMTERLLFFVPPVHRPLAAQILRYLFAGGITTALQAATYWLLAGPAGWHPQLANFVGYLVAVATGYVLHGLFTFRDHGSGVRGAGRGARFVIVSLISLGINAFWVWLMTSALKLPDWTPIPLMCVVTPAFVFTLNRQWVFR